MNETEEAAERQGLAYHEAGHAIVCVLLGIAFEEVSIVPTARGYGHTKTSPFRRGSEEEAVNFLAMLFAGMMGEALHTTGHFPESSREFGEERLSSGMLQCGDTFAAGRIAALYEAGARLYDAGYKRARALLSTDWVWRAVEEIAEELLRSDKINHDRVCEIVMEAGGSKQWPTGAIPPF
jgi:hypothetical protein